MKHQYLVWFFRALIYASLFIGFILLGVLYPVIAIVILLFGFILFDDGYDF